MIQIINPKALKVLEDIKNGIISRWSIAIHAKDLLELTKDNDKLRQIVVEQIESARDSI